jgi:hypothetical protein
LQEVVEIDEKRPVGKKARGRYKKLLHHTSKYAFALFAFIFIAFLFRFAAWLLLSSQYYDWNPSSNYNSLDPRDISERLFRREETRFWGNETDKSVKSASRFYHQQGKVYELSVKVGRDGER